MDEQRAPRADAQRNRALVLAVAKEAFAAEGPGVSLDEIAKRAGVGAGTVHRHFPTKDALLEAVILDRMSSLSAESTELVSRPDASESLFTLIERLSQEGANNLALSAALSGDRAAFVASPAAVTLNKNLTALLERAKAEGGIRQDVTPTTLHAIISGVLAMEQRLPEGNSGLGLAVVLAGLRAT